MMKVVSDVFHPKKTKTKKERKLTEKEKEEIRKRKEFFEGKKGEKRKFVAAFLTLLVVFLFFGVLRMVSSEREFKKNFFATKCEGEWQNPANAEGAPDVLPYGTIDSFSEGNSAVYKTGPQNLLCQWFNELPEAEEEQKKDPCGKDYELCDLSSTKVHLSFAIDNINDDYSMDEPKEENFSEGAFGSLNQEEIADNKKAFENVTNNKTIETIQELRARVSTKELVKDSPTETQPTEEQFSLDARIILYYSLDNGKTWNNFESIKTVPFSNYLNGGYLTFDAPFIKNWYDIKNFRIKLEGVVGGEEKIIAFLDSVWLEATARKHFRGTEEISEKIFSMFEDFQKEISSEKLEIIQKEFEYEIPSDGKIVATVIDPNKNTDGVFRIKILSDENDLLSVIDIFSNGIVNFGGYDIPGPSTDEIKRSLFLTGQESNKMAVNVKKEWGKIKVNIDYILINDDEKEKKDILYLDNLELNFYPSPILLENLEFLGESIFNLNEKTQDTIKFSNEKRGQIIVETKETKESRGAGAFVLYLDGNGIAVLEGGYLEGRTELFHEVSPGEHELVIKNVDSSWEDNEGQRKIKIYFKEEND